jgi:hypothetical protein
LQLTTEVKDLFDFVNSHKQEEEKKEQNFDWLFEIDTKLLDVDKDLKLLQEWFDGRPFTLKRHYTASDHGFTSEGFASKIAKKHDILVVVESEAGKKFGGFTSLQIFDDIAHNNIFQKDPKAFVFSLSNKTKHKV